MSYRGVDLDQEWAGLEPEQPSRRRGCYWLGILLALLLLIGICLVGGYLAWQQLIVRAGAGGGSLLPALPTPVLAPTADAEGGATAAPLAPTATLRGSSAAGNVVAGQRAAPPVIDGDLSDWDGVVAAESTFRVYSAAGWDGSDDVAAAWQLGWDADNLYLAVTVTDDVHVQTQTGNQIFRGDSVDVQIATNRAANPQPRLSPTDFQITLSPGNFADLPPAFFRFRGTEEGRMVDAPGATIAVGARRTATGYTLEAAVPWAALGLAATPGAPLGLALNVSDNDTPGTAVQEVMQSHVPTRTFTDPTTWGTLTLE